MSNPGNCCRNCKYLAKFIMTPENSRYVCMASPNPVHKFEEEIDDYECRYYDYSIRAIAKPRTIMRRNNE